MLNYHLTTEIVDKHIYPHIYLRWLPWLGKQSYLFEFWAKGLLLTGICVRVHLERAQSLDSSGSESRADHSGLYFLICPIKDLMMLNTLHIVLIN
jgi:hypothetical protein